MTLVEESFIPLLRKITGSSSQGVWLSTGLSSSIGYNKVEAREVFRPTDLSSIELLGGHKMLQFVMIGKNPNGMWDGLLFGAPFFEITYNSHEFFLIYL